MATAGNQEHLQIALTVMRRVAEKHYPFDMHHWSDDGTAKSEDDRVKCGTPACFGGWLACSPEGVSAGLYLEEDGDGGCNVVYGESDGGYAIANFLDTSQSLAWRLCGMEEYRKFYGKGKGYITARDVIKQLEKLVAKDDV